MESDAIRVVSNIFMDATMNLHFVSQNVCNTIPIARGDKLTMTELRPSAYLVVSQGKFYHLSRLQQAKSLCSFDWQAAQTPAGLSHRGNTPPATSIPRIAINKAARILRLHPADRNRQIKMAVSSSSEWRAQNMERWHVRTVYL